jgi:hypothetical protein
MPARHNRGAGACAASSLLSFHQHRDELGEQQGKRMPPKKKRSSKNKECSNEKKEVEWTREGRKHAKGLARELPETAQALKSGKQDVNDVAARLAMMDLDYLPKKDNPGEKGDWVAFLLHHLVFMILPREINENDLEVASELFEELFEDLENAFKEKLNSMNMITDGVFEAMVYAMHDAFDEIAELWESRVWSFFRLSLKDICPIYKVHRDDFLAHVTEEVSEEFDTRQFQAKGREYLDSRNASLPQNQACCAGCY